MLLGSASALERLDDRLCIDLLHYLDFNNVAGQNVRVQLRGALRREMFSFLESASSAERYVEPDFPKKKKKDSAHSKSVINQGSGYLCVAKKDMDGNDLVREVVKYNVSPDPVEFEGSPLFWQDIVRVDTLNHKHTEYYKHVLLVQLETEKDSQHTPGVLIFLAKYLKNSVPTKRIFNLFSVLEKDMGDCGLALMICLYNRAKAAIFKTKRVYVDMRKYRLPRSLNALYGSLEPRSEKLLVGCTSVLEKLVCRASLDLLHYLVFYHEPGQDLHVQLRKALSKEMLSFLESASTAKKYSPAKKSQIEILSDQLKSAIKKDIGCLYAATRDFVDIPKDLQKSFPNGRILSLFQVLRKSHINDFDLALMICLYHRAKAAIFKTKMYYHWVRHQSPRPLGEIYGSLQPRTESISLQRIVELLLK